MVADRTKAQLAALFDPVGVPVGPINDLAEVFADPFVAARGTVHRFEREDGVAVPSVAYPAKLSRTPASFRRMPPRIGEHTAELLDEWLELAPGEFAALAAAGAVRQRS